MRGVARRRLGPEYLLVQGVSLSTRQRRTTRGEVRTNCRRKTNVVLVRYVKISYLMLTDPKQLSITVTNF